MVSAVRTLLSSRARNFPFLGRRSHCDCDARFRRCLNSIGSETADLIGSIFFNVVQVTCFKEKRPCYPEDFDDRYVPLLPPAVP